MGRPGPWWGGEPTARGKRLEEPHAVCEPHAHPCVFMRVFVLECLCTLTARGIMPVRHGSKRGLVCACAGVAEGLHTEVSLCVCVSTCVRGRAHAAFRPRQAQLPDFYGILAALTNRDGTVTNVFKSTCCLRICFYPIFPKREHTSASTPPLAGPSPLEATWGTLAVGKHFLPSFRIPHSPRSACGSPKTPGIT